ncbi:hypothetical protein [Pseudomonas sp. Hp2]|uniref:hypothetical protein n=1 Tax=Pseudomonas sp. Hp2 TaxID=701189 RepID=UPI00112A243D|nr:hypothetical protein [Pseudomonas sp. Hp2]
MERPLLTTNLILAEPLMFLDANEQDLARQARSMVAAALRADGNLPEADQDTAIGDMAGIVKGMMLSAAARGAMEAPDLEQRILRAVRAYVRATAAA